MTKELSEMNIIAKNKRAWYDYQIIDTWEAGIKLGGLEVKGLRAGNVSLAESWVSVSDQGVRLLKCNITPVRLPKWEEYDPIRPRTLLLKKAEIRKIRSAILKGYTVVPLKIYFNNRGLAKIEIATAKGKKNHDKRKTLRDRDNKRLGY